MTIDDFCAQFPGPVRNIDDVMQEWQFDDLRSLLQSEGLDAEQWIGSAVVAGMASRGDGMLNQISDELRDALQHLMREKADGYAAIRDILRHAIQDEHGNFRAFDDVHVRGFISKIKGQIGENLFKEHVGAAAELASSGSQEAWDVAIQRTSDTYEYVQVKLYAEPREVIRHMLIVQEKVANGLIEGCNGELAHHINFAVPADIADRVNELKELHSHLDAIKVLSIPIDASDAAEYVKEGLANVGPDQMGHFFDELFGGAIAAGSLHALVHGFLWYKGSKLFSSAVADTAAGTTISTLGISFGMVAETLCHSAMLSGAVGISGRVLLGRLARSRWNFAGFLGDSIVATEALVVQLDNTREH